MPLILAKCTNCGANLKVDNTKDSAICEYCGSTFIVEKVVNVTIDQKNISDFVIHAGKLEEYIGASTDVIIPDCVTCIGQNAFVGLSGITSITIPNSVTTIEGDTLGFYGGAFRNCSALTSITIPDGISIIEANVFHGCSSLTSIIIPDSVTTIATEAFKDCTSLTSIMIPDSVTCIAWKAFEGCNSLTSVKIPDSITSIERLTFENCTSLTSIIIPDSVTFISPEAFIGCTSLPVHMIPTRGSSADRSFSKDTTVSDKNEPTRTLEGIKDYLLSLFNT